MGVQRISHKWKFDESKGELVKERMISRQGKKNKFYFE
jgi:hypothetical protein